MLLNHAAELVAPWFVFGPRKVRHIAGGLIVLFQMVLILSGNLSFLNWLTIIPALACFDDSLWKRILPGHAGASSIRAAGAARPSRAMAVAAWILTAAVAWLSVKPVANLVSARQVMNASFAPLELVNTYGAFGSVGLERMNVIFEGTDSAVPDEHAAWKQYVYRGLPVDPAARPPQIAPYQLRFDWQMWFAAMSTPTNYPWTVHLIWKLLHNDPGAVGLFAANPFPERPPKYIRAVAYRYKFADPGNGKGLWWTRDRTGLWLPPLSTESAGLEGFLSAYGWLPSPPNASRN